MKIQSANQSVDYLLKFCFSLPSRLLLLLLSPFPCFCFSSPPWLNPNFVDVHVQSCKFSFITLFKFETSLYSTRDLVYIKPGYRSSVLLLLSLALLFHLHLLQGLRASSMLKSTLANLIHSLEFCKFHLRYSPQTRLEFCRSVLALVFPLFLYSSISLA